MGSTGETTDHEDEDTGNIYLEGGDITASVTADAAKAIKAEGDIRATGTNVTATTSGGGGPGGGPGGGSQKLIVYTSSTPTVKSGVTVADGTEYFGGMANIGGTVSGGSDVTLSNYSSGGGWW